MPPPGSRTSGSTCSAPCNAFEAARPFLEASGEKTGDAAFVIISSISAAQADLASSYGPIKAALIHMAKGLARQYAGKKIRVNVVSPGTVYFKGGVWNMVEQNMPKRLRGCDGAQPDRPHGNAAGDRQRGGVPGKPGVGLHDGLEPRRRRRDLEPGEFSSGRAVGRLLHCCRRPRAAACPPCRLRRFGGSPKPLRCHGPRRAAR